MKSLKRKKPPYSNHKQLAKEYDFNHPTDYFNYIVESNINGQFEQVKNLFDAMTSNSKREFMTYITK